MDGVDDVLIVKTYLVDAERIPFLCGKKTLEEWNFKIDGTRKVLEIQMKTGEDNGRKFIKMEDTNGGHYGVILETKKENTILFLMEEDTGILFLEDKEGDLCSYKAVRKVHELNRHKGKDQLINAYKKAGWMTPQLQKIIDRVIKDCKVCQKFQKTVA